MPETRGRDSRGISRAVPIRLNRREREFIDSYRRQIGQLGIELATTTHPKAVVKLQAELLALGFKIGEQYVFAHHKREKS